MGAKNRILSKEREIEKLKMISNICIVIAMISLCYYIVIISYAGIKASFCWFWLCGAVISGGISYVLRQSLQEKIILSNTIQKIVVAIGLLGVIGFLIIEGVLIYYANTKPVKNADYMIVLGAQVRGTKITKSLKYRLDTAISYLEKNQNTHVIVSGGQGPGEDIAEANAMSQYLTEKGIDKSRISIEDQSRNTNENILFSKKFIKGNNKKVVIVSNGFHIFRGVSIAKKQKIGIINGLGAPTDSILRVNYYIREAFAVVKDVLVGNIRF